MKSKIFVKLCACLLGLLLLGVLPHFVYLQKSISVEDKAPLNKSIIFQELSQANVIYLGETHDDLKVYQAQLEIIQFLHSKNPKIAIGFEMFQRQFQPILNQYLAGEISEDELKDKTEYENRWGFNWEYYAPIIRFAKSHKLPILALNTPTEVSRKVAKQGLESLTPQERQFIPPTEEIDLTNNAYRQMVNEVYQDHLQQGHGNSQTLDRFFTAQVLWDETMAEAIAQFYQTHPDYKIIVLAGKGHIIYGYGIPSRVERRLKGVSFVQRLVLMEEKTETDSKNTPNAADYIWLVE